MDNMIFNSCALYGDYLYFQQAFDHVMGKMNIHNGQVEYVTDIMNYSQNILSGGIDKCIVVGDKFYGTEMSGSKLMQLDLLTNTCSCIVLDYQYEKWGNVALLTLWENHIYLVPSYGNSLVKIDIDTAEVTYESKLYDGVEKAEDGKYFTSGCRDGNIIWLEGKNKLYSFDLELNEVEVYDADNSDKEYIDIACLKEGLLLIDNEGAAISWEKNKEKQCILDMHEEGYFVKSLVTEENVYLLPSLGENIYVINRDRQNCKRYEAYPEDFCYKNVRGWAKYYEYSEDADSYYVAMRLGNYLLKVDKKTGVEEWIKPKYPSEKERIQLWAKQKYILQEQTMNLESLLVNI